MATFYGRPFGRFVRLGLLLALAGCAGRAACAEGPPASFDRERLIADAKRQRTDLLQSASKHLARDRLLLRRLKAQRDAKDDAAELARAIDQRRKEISAARRGKLYLVPYLWPHGWASDPRELYRGRAGRLTTMIVVFQVTGEDSFLARALGDEDDASFGTIWFEGLDTTNLHDDQIVDMRGWDDLFVCTGSKTYATALGGTRTVPVFRALTTNEVAEARRALSRTREAK